MAHGINSGMLANQEAFEDPDGYYDAIANTGV